MLQTDELGNRSRPLQLAKSVWCSDRLFCLLQMCPSTAECPTALPCLALLFNSCCRQAICLTTLCTSQQSPDAKHRKSHLPLHNSHQFLQDWRGFKSPLLMKCHWEMQLLLQEVKAYAGSLLTYWKNVVYLWQVVWCKRSVESHFSCKHD